MRETLLMALDRFDAEQPESAREQAVAGAGMAEGLAHVPGTCPCHPNARGVALDLGCGDGRETLEMLRRGWCVLAIDSHPEGIRRLNERTPEELRPLLRSAVETFEDLPIPPGMFDLVNASFAIPHSRPEDFPGLWARVAGGVREGGRFAGQLFGVHDDWASIPDGVTRTFHTRSEVEGLLEGFEVEMLDEVRRPGKNAYGEPKNWHVFHIVARKCSAARNNQVRSGGPVGSDGRVQ